MEIQTEMMTEMDWVLQMVKSLEHMLAIPKEKSLVYLSAVRMAL